MGFCQSCGFITNVVFDPTLHEYSADYEPTQGYSPTFNAFHQKLATDLIERYDLHGKDIIEIGCGQGEFLALLCELGRNRGVGFDRSYVPEEDSNEIPDQVTFIQDFYSAQYAGYPADLICCRHVLEHIQSPYDFIIDLRRVIEKQTETIVFFEVPNVMFTVEDLGIWDLIYEHCSYFSAGSLGHLFHRCGFEVVNLTEVYEGQFLSIEARAGEDTTDNRPDFANDPEAMTAAVSIFADRYRQKVET